VPRWAKLSVRVGQDARLCELAETNTLAALLFCWGLPAADLYGILPGDVREYASRVAPGLRVDDDEIAAAIDAQVEAGLLLRYEAGGKLLLYVCNYHKHQDVRWRRTGPPEYPLPAEWRIPRRLRELLENHSTDTPGDSTEYPGPADFGLCATPTGLSVELHGDSGIVQETPGDSGPDVDVDVDVETDVKETYDSLSADADAGEDDDLDDDLDWDLEPSDEDKLRHLHNGIPAADLDLLSEYLEHAARQNKTNTITMGRRLNETRELLDLRQEVGPEAWRYGMAAANRAGAPNPRYVTSAAESYDCRRQASGKHHTPDDFENVVTNDWGEVI